MSRTSKPILVTGAAGFIGYHTCRTLLNSGHRVIGLDNLNDYYSPQLKYARLDQLRSFEGSGNFTFESGDLCDKDFLQRLFANHRFATVINLAAQAGVRYSLTNPDVYVKSNMEGFLNILEACRQWQAGNLIYASSSSVYGLNSKMPFAEDAGADHPVSLYAASKRANELMAHSYSHLFGLPTTGLRFFTVYGPWGRPDMALSIFANAILDEKPINLFRGGDMLRDYTYIDDVVESIVRLCSLPATADSAWNSENPTICSSSAPYRLYNVGNHNPVIVRDVLTKMEALLGKPAIINLKPIQPGDVLGTYASVSRLGDAVDFAPRTSIDTGLKKFIHWLLWFRAQPAKDAGYERNLPDALSLYQEGGAFGDKCF